ncbi:MAG: VWA domain-containing protein [Deltaproteobacteria bacterium]|nr:VWA domain-containing protein [Deltaproteobacteria bacterium]
MRRFSATATATFTATILACTNSNLYTATSQPNVANKASFQGDICTEDPLDVDFLVKTLIVSDVTAEMGNDDPQSTRATAIENLLDRYTGENYVYGLVQYGRTARALTAGYADDNALLPPAIDSIRVGTPDSQRSYLEPLRVATTAVQDDILSATPGQRSRTRYVILFVVDGPPSPSLASVWCPANGIMSTNSAQCRTQLAATFCPQIQPAPMDCEAELYPQMVREMRQYALDQGAIDLEFHIVALKDETRMNALLSQMAIAGRGAFVRQQPTQVNLLQIDISTPQAILQRRELVVYNPNAIIKDGVVQPDSDQDGLTDDEEAQFGTDPTLWDTDGDLVGDAIERFVRVPGSTFDPLVPALPTECTLLANPGADSDADGLLDCEEIVLRTEPSLPDSDKDGIPDLVEVRRGGNALVDDALNDTDRDGLPNGDELKSGLDVSSSDAEHELEFGYRYRFFDEGDTQRLEVNPKEPIPGVLVSRVDGGEAGVARFHFVAPGTIAYTNAIDDPTPGPELDVSAGGTFMLDSPTGQRMQIVVTADALPLSDQDIVTQVRQTRRSCFRFDARNITLVETMEVPNGRPGRGWNDIRVYLSQLSEETPKGFGIFTVASVPVRFIAPNRKTPNRAFIDLEQTQFVLIGGGVK